MLAEVTEEDQLILWEDLGASYTVLWDKKNVLTSEVYQVTDRPMFVTIDRDMTIQVRRSNEAGMRFAEEEALRLLELD